MLKGLTSTVDKKYMLKDFLQKSFRANDSYDLFVDTVSLMVVTSISLLVLHLEVTYAQPSKIT